MCTLFALSALFALFSLVLHFSAALLSVVSHCCALHCCALLLIVVGLHVPVEVALDCKALVAVYTLKRPLSRVSSPVSF